MKESVNIANRFGDAYLVAMLEGSNADDVIRHYETRYPELGGTFRSEAKNLELLYGYMRQSEKPTEREIADAYTKVSARLAPTPTIPSPRPKPAKPSLLKYLSSLISARPVTAGASLAAVMAILLAVVLQPWKQTSTPTVVAVTEQPQDMPSTQTPEQIAPAENPSSPRIGNEPTFRGGDDIGKQDKNQLDRRDRERLSKQSTDNSLAAPTGLKVVSQKPEAVVISWNQVKNALSYVVETKRANAAEFTAVSQTSQTQARLVGLPSSERVEIRVIATSGERKGEASAAMTISVP